MEVIKLGNWGALVQDVRTEVLISEHDYDLDIPEFLEKEQLAA